ncbi:hypothetical protein ACFE04_022811 [Oxalis oulophora]
MLIWLIVFHSISHSRLCFVGIEIDDEELALFVDRVDKDHNGVIAFEEWRDFLLLYPHEASIENIYHFLERVCLIDIGEQAAIPEGISKHIHASRYLIAGGVAGATSRTATAPLDRLKVNLQVQTARADIMPAVRKIWREGGIVGFFRGNGLNVVKVAPESAIRFYTYEMLKRVIVKAKGEDAEIGAGGRLLAGGIAGAVAQMAIYPMDLVKTRLQTFVSVGGKVPNVGAMSRDIWVQEGPRVFYRGLVPSLLGMIPYAGIDLAVYETLKDLAKKYMLHDTDPGPLIQLGCGTISGALGATCVYPLQVVRTRMQAQRASTGADSNKMSDIFRKTFKKEGYRGFYKGLLPNMLKVVPSASITYLVRYMAPRRMEGQNWIVRYKWWSAASQKHTIVVVTVDFSKDANSNIFLVGEKQYAFIIPESVCPSCSWSRSRILINSVRGVFLFSDMVVRHLAELTGFEWAGMQRVNKRKEKVLQNDVDLLNPPVELEKKKHKLKRLVQTPNSFFMDVKCQAQLSSATHKLWLFAATASRFCASPQEVGLDSLRDAPSGKRLHTGLDTVKLIDLNVFGGIFINYLNTFTWLEMPYFQCYAFNHSAISPRRCAMTKSFVCDLVPARLENQDNYDHDIDGVLTQPLMSEVAGPRSIMLNGSSGLGGHRDI